MKHLRTSLIILALFAAPSVGSTQQLPRNLSCQDLLDVANGRLSRLEGNAYVPIPTPKPVDQDGQALLAYDTALCRRLSNGEITVEEFNSLHAAKVQSLQAERRRMADERQKLAIEAAKLQAQQQSVELQGKAIEAQQQQSELQRQQILQQQQIQRQQLEYQRRQALQQQRQLQELEAMRQEMERSRQEQQMPRSFSCYQSGRYTYCN